MARLATTRGGSGEPLVLIHGLGSSRTVWDTTRPALEEHHDVIAVDLPGFGDQPWFDDGSAPTMDALTNAVQSEMDELGIRKATIVGNSMGGWIALELARRGRATDAIAISPVGGATPREARKSKAVLRANRIASKASWPIGKVALRWGPLRRLGFSSVATREVPYEDAVTALRYNARAVGVPKLLGEVGGSGDLFEVNRDRFAQIRCPVLIMWGSDDRVLSAAGGPRLAGCIPNAELMELDGWGHSPMLDRADELASLILIRTSAPT